MAERTVSSVMSLKTQESMRKKLEEWRKTKAQKQLNCKTPFKTSNYQETHTKRQSSIKNTRKSMPYGLSSIHGSKENKDNRVLKRKSLNTTSRTAGQKCTKAQKVTNEEPKPIPLNNLAFSANPPKDFDTESDVDPKKSRRSTFTKEELVFYENPPSNFEIESEPDSKKARRSTFTVDSPNPVKDSESSKPIKAPKSSSTLQSKSVTMKPQNNTMKMKESQLKSRRVTKDLPRKVPIKQPAPSRPPKKSTNTIIKKPEERKPTFAAKVPGKKPTQTIKHALPAKQSNFPNTSIAMKAPKAHMNKSKVPGEKPTQTIKKAVPSKQSNIPKKSVVTTPKAADMLNKSISLRQRLEMWRKEKGKVSQFPKTPLIQRKSNVATAKIKKCIKSENAKPHQNQPLQVIENDNTKKESTEKIREKLQANLEKLKADNEDNFEEIACQMDEISKNHKEALQFAEYWVCRAEIAQKSGDHSRVVCLYQQAIAFNAQPASLIQDKISNFAMDTKAMQEKAQDEFEQDACVTLPVDQQQVHQPSKVATQMTPSKTTSTAEFMSPSSTIRYSVTKPTPYRNRRKTCERPTVTPVRRSVRLERRSIHYPLMLQDHNLIVRHLDELPCDIKEDISFKPNFTVKSELNDAWKEIMEC